PRPAPTLFSTTNYTFGLTNPGHLRSRPAPAPNDRNKMADPPIPSGNNVGDPELLRRVRARFQRTRTNFRSISPRVRAHCTHQRRAKYRRKCRSNSTVRDSTPWADPAKFARVSPQCRNRLRRHRTISGSELHPAAVFAEAVR